MKVKETEEERRARRAKIVEFINEFIRDVVNEAPNMLGTRRWSWPSFSSDRGKFSEFLSWIQSFEDIKLFERLHPLLLHTRKPEVEISAYGMVNLLELEDGGIYQFRPHQGNEHEFRYAKDYKDLWLYRFHLLAGLHMFLKLLHVLTSIWQTPPEWHGDMRDATGTLNRRLNGMMLYALSETFLRRMYKGLGSKEQKGLVELFFFSFVEDFKNYVGANYRSSSFPTVLHEFRLFPYSEDSFVSAKPPFFITLSRFRALRC
ncbi:hypothetical protein BJ508DRAFT_131771 [Ascobolus immersus RN42]|uniref:Uncharacterized protein n=1 Tax=Ascobolus immersus RN42 TaxID=1160509 RepID=A0A3N4I230_ASCIM|nr:hypothetical protein BJ508DRAFT_131771 [Ascobolus immersus RN42]